ncbi:MAG: aromatic amino acid transport family protein [bacterium]|nr:aromatic amino acid transport family protein [bacterium]
MAIKSKNFLLALSVLIGTIIGAGIFGIPYVIFKSGLIPGLFYFVVLGGAVLLIHLFFGETILRTKEKCRLPGLAQRYLGNWGEKLVMLSVAVGITGALLAYLILGGEFLRILLSSFLNLSQAQFTLIFWVLLSCFIFRGIKLIAPAELITNFLFFFIVFIIFFFSLPKFNFSNLPVLNLPDIFLPFGVILFSLIGWSALPEMLDFLKLPQEKKQIKKIIIAATLIVVLFYIFFALAVIGVAGKGVSQDALSGLLPFLGPKIIFWGVLAALITLADSFLVLGLYLKNTFIYDLKFSKNLATLVACGLPLVLFLVGFRSFIATLGFVGTVVGAVEGIIIILIFRKAKKLGDREPEYSLKVPSLLLYFLIAILIFGAVFQIISR